MTDILVHFYSRQRMDQMTKKIYQMMEKEIPEVVLPENRIFHILSETMGLVIKKIEFSRITTTNEAYVLQQMERLALGYSFEMIQQYKGKKVKFLI